MGIVCLYGAASDAVGAEYIAATEALGREIAARGWGMIYGGGGTGMMGAAARGVASGGGKIISVLPRFMSQYESLFEGYTEKITTETMAERKRIMEEGADAFLITPGGVGTMDEFFQVLTLKTLDRHEKPIVLYNINGFYNKQIEFLEQGIAEGFISPACRHAFVVCDTPQAAMDAVMISLC